jgi:hypothetical protein
MIAVPSPVNATSKISPLWPSSACFLVKVAFKTGDAVVVVNP